MFTFQFVNETIHNLIVNMVFFFDIIVNFIIQTLKSKHTSLKITQTEQN